MHASTKLPTPLLRATPALVLALVLLVGLAVGGAWMLNMGRIAPGTRISEAALASTQNTAPQTLPMPARQQVLGGGPGWELMTTPQKLALYPLAERWAYLSEAQKRHWLALAQNFASMPEAEQDRLHARMTTWASLSAQQRSQARLNFAVTRSLAPHDIKSEWEIYQALSTAEKQRLAAKAAKPKGAATALRPVPSKRLAHVPAATEAQAKAANPPKIVFPESSAVRQSEAPAATTLAPVPAASSGDNAGTEQSTPAAQPPTDLADPLPPVYIN